MFTQGDEVAAVRLVGNEAEPPGVGRRNGAPMVAAIARLHDAPAHADRDHALAAGVGGDGEQVLVDV